MLLPYRKTPFRPKPFMPTARRVAPEPPPVGPLQLLSATITATGQNDITVSLAFDNNADDPIAPLPEGLASCWTAAYGGMRYSGSEIVIASATTLTLTLIEASSSESPTGISYDPQEPAEIATENGRVLGAFADVPFEQ
jgi:hypothetical protein